MKFSQTLQDSPLYARLDGLLARLKANRYARMGFWSLVFILAALIFGLAHTQSLLYEGNQNTKFLHGLAMTGQAFLEDDWLANTADPLPVFSILVYLTALVAERLFYVYYFILFGVYALALVGIAGEIFPHERDWARPVLLFGLLVILHSIWQIKRFEREYSLDLTLVQYGLADQYLLGEEFQNSSFGVLLLLSIWLFLKRKHTLAVLSLAAAAILHPAYLFSAALLVAAYAAIAFWEHLAARTPSERWSWASLRGAAGPPIRMGLLALILVLPVVLYQMFGMPSSDPLTAQKALRILVHERIPHHTQLSTFLGPGAYFQIALSIAGLLLARRSRLGFILGMLFAGGLLLSVVQALNGSDSLALLGPWRVSVLLVPIATTLLLAGLIHFTLDTLRLGSLPYQWLALPVLAYFVFVAVSFGVDFQQRLEARFKTQRVNFFTLHVRQSAQAGETYLIPPLDGELNDFRLLAGVPILANWKSHPYRDVEVLEWYHRVELAERFYSATDARRCSMLTALLESYPQVTHVVDTGKERSLDCDFLNPTYEYYGFKLYEVKQ